MVLQFSQGNEEVDYKKAFEYFSRGATLGNDANCFYKLGDMYMHGSYVEKNPNIAYNYYLKAFVKQLHLIETIKGAGFLTSVALMCEIGDFSVLKKPNSFLPTSDLTPP